MRLVKGNALLITLLAGCLLVYTVAVDFYNKSPRYQTVETMEVALPTLLQVPLALGDRYLAANVEVFRAMVLDVSDPQHQYLNTLAKVQEGVAMLNPAHEDNYYIAQAILPWGGAVGPNQHIQILAMNSRPWDFLPGFFAAFNQLYFYQNPLKAGEILYSVAGRQPEHKQQIIELAARWQEKGQDLSAAIQLVQAMEKSARNPALKNNLHLRVVRLQGLQQLRVAAEKYRLQHGHYPESLSELQQTGLIKQLPVDPLGIGYGVDATGLPVLLKPITTNRAKVH